MQNVDFAQFITLLIVLFLGVGLHEFAHCKMADLAGDPTPGSYGRVTLNLTKHFEPIGTVMMILSSLTGFGIGWGRPAPMDPRKMKNPRWDFFAAVAAGPLSNVAQAIVYGLLFRLFVAGGFLAQADRPGPAKFLLNLAAAGIIVNISLALFNLIPFGPLDGHWLVGLLLPEKQRYYWYKFNRQVGMFGLFAVIIILDYLPQMGGPNLIAMLMNGPVAKIFRILTGIPLS